MSFQHIIKSSKEIGQHNAISVETDNASNNISRAELLKMKPDLKKKYYDEQSYLKIKHGNMKNIDKKKQMVETRTFSPKLPRSIT